MTANPLPTHPQTRRISRRRLLKLGSTALLLTPIGAGAMTTASNTRPNTLWVYDPAYPSTLNRGAFHQVINVAEERKTAWRHLRALERVDTAAGITRWSDFLIVRGHLESCGMRLLDVAENHSIFHWAFANARSR